VEPRHLAREQQEIAEMASCFPSPSPYGPLNDRRPSIMAFMAPYSPAPSPATVCWCVHDVVRAGGRARASARARHRRSAPCHPAASHAIPSSACRWALMLGGSSGSRADTATPLCSSRSSLFLPRCLDQPLSHEGRSVRSTRARRRTRSRAGALTPWRSSEST